MQHRPLAFTMKFCADIRTKRHTAFVVLLMLPMLPVLLLSLRWQRRNPLIQTICYLIALKRLEPPVVMKNSC